MILFSTSFIVEKGYIIGILLLFHAIVCLFFLFFLTTPYFIIENGNVIGMSIHMYLFLFIIPFDHPFIAEKGNPEPVTTSSSSDAPGSRLRKTVLGLFVLVNEILVIVILVLIFLPM